MCLSVFTYIIFWRLMIFLNVSFHFTVICDYMVLSNFDKTVLPKFYHYCINGFFPILFCDIFLPPVLGSVFKIYIYPSINAYAIWKWNVWNKFFWQHDSILLDLPVIKLLIILWRKGFTELPNISQALFSSISLFEFEIYFRQKNILLICFVYWHLLIMIFVL